MSSNSSSSDEEWRKKGVEFKIIDEGERENKSKESKIALSLISYQKQLVFFWIF